MSFKKSRRRSSEEKKMTVDHNALRASYQTVRASYQAVRDDYREISSQISGIMKMMQDFMQQQQQGQQKDPAPPQPLAGGGSPSLNVNAPSFSEQNSGSSRRPDIPREVLTIDPLPAPGTVKKYISKEVSTRNLEPSHQADPVLVKMGEVAPKDKEYHRMVEAVENDVSTSMLEEPTVKQFVKLQDKLQVEMHGIVNESNKKYHNTRTRELQELEVRAPVLVQDPVPKRRIMMAKVMARRSNKPNHLQLQNGTKSTRKRIKPDQTVVARSQICKPECVKPVLRRSPRLSKRKKVRLKSMKFHLV